METSSNEEKHRQRWLDDINDGLMTSSYSGEIGIENNNKRKQLPITGYLDPSYHRLLLAVKDLSGPAGMTLSFARAIKVGEPQGGLLGPVLHLLYASDMPNIPDTIITQYAGLTTSKRLESATSRLKAAFNKLKL